MDFHRLLQILLVVSMTSVAQLLLRLSMRDSPLLQSDILGMLQQILQTPLLWLAIGLYGVSTLFWLRIVAEYPVSAVYPMIAIGYVFVTIGGVVFLKENVSLQAWIALAIICVGTLLLASTPAQTG